MTSLQISVSSPIPSIFVGNLDSNRCCLGLGFVSPTNCCSVLRRNISSLYRNGSFWREGMKKDVILVRKGRKGSLVAVRANQGFNGGGGGWDRSTTARVLSNLALAIGLTYLSMTGQLGWVLDAIVSIWLIAVLLPIVGLGAFFWFAGRDIVQSSCPNCGNEFQIFKSSLKDGPQLCPFCSQPFSVLGNKFVRESARFSSDRSTTYGQAFNGFSSRTDQGKASSTAVVDVEAEVKDID
ncbi:Diphthamide biosynthesis protein 3 [Cocos nucifera]|uniref:Diphthamide biosynthesis protein 3 n=1 Tax=Cocos nucifera TaxID=13894 RepID=A0A8K0IBG7_COCNU|nr:Diphthamide biosynthesis protein 3 [Cocos nucifera]